MFCSCLTDFVKNLRGPFGVLLVSNLVGDEGNIASRVATMKITRAEWSGEGNVIGLMQCIELFVDKLGRQN